MQKPKLTIQEQINHLQKRGIAFVIFNKNKAQEFLESYNYFFKIKSYAKNYEQCSGIYKNIDFAYLVEFSTLDMHFRRLVLSFSLDIEHILKVLLNKHFANNQNEDGYSIVKNFLSQNAKVSHQIRDKSKKISFIKNLTQKYQNNFALWNFIEILSFGEFLEFYKFYFDVYPSKIHENLYLLAYCVRILRNAAAHNNCMLNTLKIPYNNNFKPTKMIQTEIAKIPNISKATRTKILNNPTLHDFIALLMLFNQICISKKMRRAKKREMIAFLKRCKKHKEYFVKENFLLSRFIAIEKIIFSLYF